MASSTDAILLYERNQKALTKPSSTTAQPSRNQKPKPATQARRSRATTKPKTHHGGTETRRKTGENQLHRGGAEKNLISMKICDTKESKKIVAAREEF